MITDEQLSQAEANLKLTAKLMKENKVARCYPRDKEGKSVRTYGARTVRITLMMINEIRVLRARVKELESREYHEKG